MIVIKEKHKEFKHYSIKEIKPWHIVQLMFKDSVKIWSYSTHIRVLRIDPSWTWKIIWEGIHADKWEEYLFHVDFIYRNYSLDPIIVWNNDYKSKKQEEFSRKILYW